MENTISSRRNDGTNGYVPRFKQDPVVKGWKLYSWKKVLRAQKSS